MITASEAMRDFREELLCIIMKDYPDHKKIWKAEEINNVIAQVMYKLAIEYLER